MAACFFINPKKRKMNNLNYYYHTVEDAIAKLGLDPMVTRKQEGQWNLTKGTTPVWIDVFYNRSENRIYFQVAAPVMKMPEMNPGKVALELLELNNQLYGVAFVSNRGNIFIKTIREAEGLDVNEAHAMILRVGNYANSFGKELKAKYPNWVPANFSENNISSN